MRHAGVRVEEGANGALRVVGTASAESLWEINALSLEVAHCAAAVAGFYAEYTEKREPDLLISEVSLAPVAGGLRASCDLRHPTGKDISWLSRVL